MTLSLVQHLLNAASLLTMHSTVTEPFPVLLQWSQQPVQQTRVAPSGWDGADAGPGPAATATQHHRGLQPGRRVALRRALLEPGQRPLLLLCRHHPHPHPRLQHGATVGPQVSQFFLPLKTQHVTGFLSSCQPFRSSFAEDIYRSHISIYCWVSDQAHATLNEVL